MTQPTSIHLTLGQGALAQFFPELDCSQEPLLSLSRSFAAMLQRTLAKRYGIARVEVVLRPEMGGRMRLVLGGRDVDGEAEREQIWSLAQQVSRWIYA